MTSILPFSGDIENNLWPTNNNSQNVRTCQWNLNNISVENLISFPLIEASHNVDVIYLSEMFLNSSNSNDHPRLKSTFTLIIILMKTRMCLYYKDQVTLIPKLPITHPLNECFGLVCELKINNKKPHY